MPTLVETGVYVLPLLLPLSGLQALLEVFGLAGDGVDIHNAHVVNTFCPQNPEVSD